MEGKKRMHLLDRDISLRKQTENQFDTCISENWSINGVPNGGYILALMAHAMTEQSRKKTSPIFTIHYLSRSEPGKAVVDIENVSQSNQFQHIQSKLIQGGIEKARAFGTFSGGPNGNFFKRYENSAPETRPLEKCIMIPELPAFTLYRQIDIRVDPHYAGWLTGNMSEKSEIRGWIKFKNDRAFDLCALVLLADSFPPPIFTSLGKIPWVPTIEFSVNIRNSPKTEWLKFRATTRYITFGMMEVDGEIWDEEGELSAISRQIAQFRKLRE